MTHKEYTSEQFVKIEDCKEGEYIKRKADAKKVYQRGAYDRTTKSYSLIDCDDINREVFVKRGTLVFVGFIY